MMLLALLLAGKDMVRAQPPAPPRTQGLQPKKRAPVFAHHDGKSFGPAWYIDSYALVRAKTGARNERWRFEDIKLERSGRLYDALGGAEISNSVFRRISSTDARSGLLRLRGHSSNILIEDFEVHNIGVNTSPGDTPAGIALAGKRPDDNGSNILIRRGVIDGMRSSHNRYLNGDGIAIEAGYTGVRLEGLRLSNNSDAGLDNKAATTRCADITAAHNRRNFKLWYGITCDGPVKSVDPDQPGSGAPAHFLIMGKPDGSSIFRFSQIMAEAKDKVPIFTNGRPGIKATVIVDRCTLNVPAGTAWAKDPGNDLTFKLGTGCRPPAGTDRGGGT